MRPGGRRVTLLSLLLLVAAPHVLAHSTSTSWLVIEEAAGPTAPLTLRWDLSVFDLQWTIDFESDPSGTVDATRVPAKRAAIERVVLQGLELTRGGQPCTLRPSGFEVVTREEDPHASLRIEAECPAPGRLAIATRLFFTDDASQRILLEARVGGARHDAVLGPLAPRWEQPERRSAWRAFGSFLVEGAWHVWIGYDHIAFLLLLLLPAVLEVRDRRWARDTDLRRVGFGIFKLVTAFTVAHSITLGLAASGLVTLPSGFVEAAIAASIIVAGLLNLRPGAACWRLPVASAFGLVHGFGFANALAELGSQGAGLLPLLGGFNLGVELGQLAIVAVALPVLILWARQPSYAPRAMPVLSILTAALGAWWLFERI